MESKLKGREKYKALEADIIGIHIAIDEPVVLLTLYSDKKRTQTTICLDVEGTRQVAEQLNSIMGIKPDTRTVLEGYQ